MKYFVISEAIIYSQMFLYLYRLVKIHGEFVLKFEQIYKEQIAQSNDAMKVIAKLRKNLAQQRLRNRIQCQSFNCDRLNIILQ